MSSDAVKAFNDQVAASPTLQAQLQAVTSPREFLALAQAAGFDLTGQDLSAIAQAAFQQWLDRLDPKLRDFFRQVHDTPTLDEQLKACQSIADVIALGRQCSVALSAAELQQAAQAAESVPGFSFEKLWFRRLGLIQG